MEIRAKIFEPFFTTKPTGEGTGVIELPVAAARGASARAPEQQVLPPASPTDMLVVDDEPDVAAVLAEAIAKDGHHVDTAMNGAIALGLVPQWRQVAEKSAHVPPFASPRPYT